MLGIGAEALAVLAGLAGGIVLGFASRAGDFCTLGAIESTAYGHDKRRAYQWALMLGAAIIGAFVLEAVGLAALTQTLYLATAWNPLASIAGGLLFGYGMALAGNCGFGALVRMGGGDLRSFLIVMILGVAGYVTLAGPLAPVRVALFPPETAAAPQGIAHALGVSAGLAPVWIALPLGAALVALGLAHAPLRRARRMVWAGLAVAAALVWALVATSWLNDDGFGAVAVEGFSFVVPLGQTILYAMTSTARAAGFAVGAVTGVVAGAALAAFWRRQFRWEACEDPRELGRQVLGAVLMGVGGVLALGCSIGQGGSAMAVLAFSAPVTLAAIIVGALIGLRQLLSGFQSA